jgi:hypothetical protein
MNVHVVVLIEHDRDIDHPEFELLRPMDKQGLEQLIAFLHSGIGIWTIEIKEFDKCVDALKWFLKDGDKIHE